MREYPESPKKLGAIQFVGCQYVPKGHFWEHVSLQKHTIMTAMLILRPLSTTLYLAFIAILHVSLYYIEWAYQRSRLCRKCDVTIGSICEPGHKCDVNLRLNPYKWWWIWTVVGFLIIFMRARYMRRLQWFLCSTGYVYWQASPVVPLLRPLNMNTN